MKLWNFYFIAKLFLYFSGYIDFHVIPNILFALVLLIPLRPPILSLARQILAIPAGIALLYHDSWLPPFVNMIAQSARLLEFSSSYLAELAGRFISWPVIAALCGLFLTYYLLNKHFKLTPTVVAAMLVPLVPIDTLFAFTGRSSHPAQQIHASEAELSQTLEAFYKQQQSRVVTYSPAPKSDTPFDIIFLQVCSLSWDDLKVIKETENPFIKRFNFIFTNFNSATAYSEPAMIRLQHGSCGQEKHDEMYDPAAPECHTLNALKVAGYETQVALNHNGIGGDFLSDLHEIGNIKTEPMNLDDIRPATYSFDDSPIYNDYEVLSKWWKHRMTSTSPRTVLYYNTITMHDGVHSTVKYSKDSLAGYHPRAIRLFADLDRFFTLIESSGRRAVVIFIPEHGTNLRGDRMQISGMREIPSPNISIVPVGIKLIGMDGRTAANTQIISQPSSYIAVSTILSRLISNSPFNKNIPNLHNYLPNLPETEFVSENNKDTLLMRYNEQYYLFSHNSKWSPYHP